MNREKKKTHFNFIDIVILLIILAVIGAAVYLISSSFFTQKDSRQTGITTFTVRLSSVDVSSLSLFLPGTIVKDSVNGDVLGDILSIRTEKTKYYGKVAIANEEGTGYIVPVSEYENKVDIYVTVRCTAEMSSRGIQYVGNTKILVGSAVYFKIPSFASVSYITEYSLMQ